MNRRAFIYSSVIPLLGTIKRGPSQSYGMISDPAGDFNPIIQQKLLKDPVIIESLNLYEKNGNWFIRVRSRDGVEGWSVGHPKKMKLSQLVFTKIISPFMQNKDARAIDTLVDKLYLHNSNYKMQGQLFWVALAATEFAIIDLLGKTTKCSAATLLGGHRRKLVDLYVANNHRTKDVKDSLRRIIKSVNSIDAKALKFKVGGRMKVVDTVPHRTEKLIPMVAEALGDKCTLYADANSSYISVNKAIQVGKILESNGVSLYEEPVPFDYLSETKRVAEALEIPVAWGEQESSQWRFKWMIENSGVRIFQPDLFYYGGLIRSLRVARMAAAKQLNCTPHISGGGLGFIYMGIYASCCQNPGLFQEYKGITDDFPWESTGSKIEIQNGSMTTPDGHGIGVNIDPDYLASANIIR